jgi:hypothetical protein
LEWEVGELGRVLEGWHSKVIEQEKSQDDFLVIRSDSSSIKMNSQETASDDCNILRTLVCVCQ